jgi:hypothetical protein
VEGIIYPVEHHDRSLGAYQSHYADVRVNDLRLRERTCALDGNYSSLDKISLRARIDDSFEFQGIKPAGTNVYTFNFVERWPVMLTASRTLEYTGQQINDRDFVGNNLDFAGSNLIYNNALSKDRKAVMWLDRMNATVRLTDDAILEAEFMPTKYLGYLMGAKTTGIADLMYKHTGPSYDVKRGNYLTIDEGEERYYGTYTIMRKMETRSVFENYSEINNQWLPCCYDCRMDMYRKNQDTSSQDSIFNCS